MKILIIGINYYPELTGIGKYSGEMGEWLASHDCDVRVVTAPPYYPAWKVDDGYSSFKYRIESIHGVSILRCPVWVPSRPTGIKRILHLGSFAISSFIPSLWAAIFWRPSVIIVIEPPIMCAPIALLSAFLSRATSWLHVQDFEIDAAFELGIIKSRWLRSFITSIERRLMRRFDIVSSISDKMLGHLKNKGVDQDRTLLFPNWVDTELIYPLRKDTVFRRDLGITENKIVLLYSGNMGKKQGLEIIIDAARLLQEDLKYVFILCGQGAERIVLEEKASGLHNIHFMSLQPINRLNELLNSADIHLLPQRAGAEDLVMPSKLTAMMASGRPVLATATQGGQIANALIDCGLLIEPGNVNDFVDAIRHLGADSAGRERMGQAARDYALTNWGKNQVLTSVYAKKLEKVNIN